MGLRVLCVAILLASGWAPAFAAQLPVTTDDVVVWAKESLTLTASVSIASGQVVVNDPGGVATVRRFVRTLPGTQLIADTVAVRSITRQKPEFFDLFANVVDAPNGATINGDGPVAVTLPLFTFPIAPVVTPGTDPCPVHNRVPGNCFIRFSDGVVTLQPGNYGNLNVSTFGVLAFAGGTYNFKSLRAGTRAVLIFNGTTTVNVAGRVFFGRMSLVGPNGDLNGRCIAINVAGDSVRIFSSQVDAMITAPDASLSLGLEGVYRGTFVGKKARVEQLSVLEAAPKLPLCP